ncbi:amidohydrolase family protein [Fodinibius sediminis]|uniref:Amidohydrolase n=1 Tax=Fodinibius sediminis TaxID=1214077 RepID=A0A521C0J3_9BACT|nr:amidohydrolase family protein [Fodinibius sediminis]SMO52908.1 Amidohydrolase [Fodinibius sediminis]
MLPIDAFPKIDAHVHFNADRTNLLEMASKFNFSMLTINTEVPEFPSVDEQMELAQKHQGHAGVDLFYVCTVSTEGIFEKGWAERAIQKIKHKLSEGARGVKFWKNIGMSIQRPDGSFLMLDNPELEPVFAYLEEQQIPVLGHQGEPRNCWLPVEEMTVKSDRDYFSGHPEYHMYKHDEYPDYWDHIESRDKVLSRHPGLRFIGLHLASLEWNLDEVTERLETYPNLPVDLAERISHLYYHTAENRQKVIDFFDTFQDRIIYGTDIINDPSASPEAINRDLEKRWTTHWDFFASDRELESPQVEPSFRGLDLPRTILEKIYRTNAQDWYHLD